jgi:hypothetical protein
MVSYVINVPYPPAKKTSARTVDENMQDRAAVNRLAARFKPAAGAKQKRIRFAKDGYVTVEGGGVVVGSFPTNGRYNYSIAYAEGKAWIVRETVGGMAMDPGATMEGEEGGEDLDDQMNEINRRDSQDMQLYTPRKGATNAEMVETDIGTMTRIKQINAFNRANLNGDAVPKSVPALYEGTEFGGSELTGDQRRADAADPRVVNAKNRRKWAAVLS